MQRRLFLQSTLSVAQVSLLLGLGLRPVRALASWPADAFHAKNLPDVEHLLFGDADIADSGKIQIDAPEIAENGVKVPVDISIDLPAVEAITLFSEKNPFPLLAQARLTPEVEPYLSLRVKMGDSGNLIAIVKSDGTLFRATRAVKVTAGGCGG